MLNDETKRKLRLMGIGEYIHAIELQDEDDQMQGMSFSDRFQQLTDSVYQQKYDAKVEMLIKGARFRLPHADVHDVFYHKDRPIDRNLINSLYSIELALTLILGPNISDRLSHSHGRIDTS